jgi:LysR family transcriptional activator of glutamate synthase operon
MRPAHTRTVQIEDFRRLLTLADHPRLTDAAAALRMSQPTLSRLLARIEKEVGARLFERDARGVHANPHGEVVLAAARDIVDRYDQLRDDVADLLDPDSGTVRLAFLDSMATSLVPRILQEFRRQAPRVRVVLRQEPGHVILEDLASGAAEVALMAQRALGPPALGGVHGWLPLQRQRLFLAVPAGHRLAARKRVRIEQLAEEDVVTVPRGFGYRSHVDELFATAGVVPRVAFESGDLATVEGLVGAGLGVALVPEGFAGASQTVGIALAAADAERVIGLTWRSDRALAPAAARFVDVLRNAAPFD